MRIAVPMTAGRIPNHLGHCESFLFVDVVDGTIRGERELPNPGHGPGGPPPSFVARERADQVLAWGMPPHAREVFARLGIRVQLGATGDARAAVRDFLAGTLALTTDALDAGGGCGHGPGGHHEHDPTPSPEAPMPATPPPTEARTNPPFSEGRALDLVAYQTGSVVSREVVRKKTGSVTLFAFDEAQGLSEHTAPFDALVHVLEGVAEITLGGAPHRVTGGEMLLMPARVPHALKAVTRFKMMLVMIREPA